MKFIHKNVNTALLMLIVFISTALAATAGTATVLYGGLYEDNAALARETRELSLALSEKEYLASQLKETADLKAQREEKLTEILAQQREEKQPEQERAVEPVVTRNTKVPSANTGYSVNYRTAAYQSPYRLPSLRYV